jgi:Protein of unknown function (DUF1559)
MFCSRFAKPMCTAHRHWQGIATAVLGAFLLAFLGDRFGWSAQDEPPSAPKAALPADLERLPGDAALLVSIRVADVWNSDPVKIFRQQKAQELAEGLKMFQKEIGVPPEDIERATVVMTEFKSKGPLVFVTTIKPFDRAKILATVVPGLKAEKRNEQIFFVSDKDQAVFILNDRTYALGAAETVRGYLDRPAAAAGALSEAIALATQKHQVVGALNVAAFAHEAGERLPPQMEAFKDLLKARSATWAVDIGQHNQAHLRLNFASEADAKGAEKPLRAAIDLARVGIAMSTQEMSRQPGGGPNMTDMLKLVDAALQTASIEKNGTHLQIALSIKADASVVVATMVEGVQKVRQSASRMQSVNNLKQLALAMHNYLSTYNHFPPQAIYSKDGKPLLSWRVLILPYIEQDALFKDFKLDEAWDGPHNKKLLAQMPQVFANPDLNTKEPVTVYQGFVGPGAFFEGKKGFTIAEFTDGTSNTLILAEAATPVPWTKPEDLPYDPNNPLPKVGGHRSDGFAAAFCDGSVRILRPNIKESVLRALITRNGGETLNANDF